MRLNQYDFIPRYFRLAIANLVSNLMVPLSGLVSIAFLGHLTEIHHLAGVALATVLFNYLYRTLNFLRLSITGVTAQAAGRNDREAVLLIGLRNILIALGLGLMILLVQYPLREAGFALLSGAPEVRAAGVDYFNARIWGAPAVTLNLVLIGWLIGREQSGKVVLLSIVGNGANIALSYQLINQWGWSSTGAGLAQTLGQWLMALLGVFWIASEISPRESRALFSQVWNGSDLKQIFTLNRDLFVRSLFVGLTYSLFTGLCTSMGTLVLTETALLFEVVMLSIYIFDGLGYATETLTGHFQGNNAKAQFVPLLGVSMVVSLVTALVISLVCVLFPQTVFGLLTNHSEVTTHISVYTPWLILVLILCAITIALESYFLGLAKGAASRNAVLVGTGLGFVPVALIACYLHNPHLLWLALSFFLVGRTVFLSVLLPKTLENAAETPAPAIMAEPGSFQEVYVCEKQTSSST